MKALFKFVFSLSLLFLLLKNVKPQDLAHNFLSFSARTIICSVALFFISWAISVYKWKILLPAFSFARLVSTTFVGQFYSTVLPGQIAGEVVKAYRLGKGQSNAEEIAASVLVDKLIGLLGLLAVASVGLVASHTVVPIEISLSIGLCSLFFFVGLFALKIPSVYLLISSLLRKLALRRSHLDQLVLRIFNLLDAWESYLNQPFRLFWVFLLGAIFQLICVWIIILFSHELEINLPFADWCWIFGLVSVAVLLPITIGGIGVREGAFVGALSLHGIPVEKSIALSLAVFAISLLGAAIGGLLELFRAMRSPSGTINPEFRNDFLNSETSLANSTPPKMLTRYFAWFDAVKSTQNKNTINISLWHWYNTIKRTDYIRFCLIAAWLLVIALCLSLAVVSFGNMHMRIPSELTDYIDNARRYFEYCVSLLPDN